MRFSLKLDAQSFRQQDKELWNKLFVVIGKSNFLCKIKLCLIHFTLKFQPTSLYMLLSNGFRNLLEYPKYKC